ncbi:MAG: hypothetical protein O7C67_04220, partial [Gammaproteobacteria bacterium]|nr:hypothetical protein [Gammaproteobacteria bacterium]
MALQSSPALAQQGQAVVGSYRNHDYAEDALRRVHEVLALEAVIVETDIDATHWYRVVIDDPEPRAMVANLRAHGFPSAWFLPSESVSILNSPGRPRQDTRQQNAPATVASVVPTATTLPSVLAAQPVA